MPLRPILLLITLALLPQPGQGDAGSLQALHAEINAAAAAAEPAVVAWRDRKSVV